MSGDHERFVWTVDPHEGPCVLDKLTNEVTRSSLVPARIRTLTEENERLRRLITHCDECGGDYAATGVESGCPCRLQRRDEKMEALIEELEDSRPPYGATFQDFIRTDLGYDKVNISLGKVRELVQEKLRKLTEEHEEAKNEIKGLVISYEKNEWRRKALAARVAELEAVLRECANDGCGLTVGSGTCLELGFSKDDSCWCCNARRALAQRDEPAPRVHERYAENAWCEDEPEDEQRSEPSASPVCECGANDWSFDRTIVEGLHGMGYYCKKCGKREPEGEQRSEPAPEQEES